MAGLGSRKDLYFLDKTGVMSLCWDTISIVFLTSLVSGLVEWALVMWDIGFLVEPVNTLRASFCKESIGTHIYNHLLYQLVHYYIHFALRNVQHDDRGTGETTLIGWTNSWRTSDSLTIFTIQFLQLSHMQLREFIVGQYRLEIPDFHWCWMLEGLNKLMEVVVKLLV